MRAPCGPLVVIWDIASLGALRIARALPRTSRFRWSNSFDILYSILILYLWTISDWLYVI